MGRFRCQLDRIEGLLDRIEGIHVSIDLSPRVDRTVGNSNPTVNPCRGFGELSATLANEVPILANNANPMAILFPNPRLGCNLWEGTPNTEKVD